MAIFGPRIMGYKSKPDPARPLDGVQQMWTREIYGVRYGFTRVIMPDGELRWFQKKWVPSPILDPVRFPTVGEWVRLREVTLYPDGRVRGQRFNN